MSWLHPIVQLFPCTRFGKTKVIEPAAVTDVFASIVQTDDRAFLSTFCGGLEELLAFWQQDKERRLIVLSPIIRCRLLPGYLHSCLWHHSPSASREELVLSGVVAVLSPQTVSNPTPRAETVFEVSHLVHAHISWFQTHPPTIYAKIVTSVWQEHINIRKALPSQVRMY